MAARLSAARQRKGISQEALARLVNMSQKSIQRYENGEQRPSRDARQALATVLGVSEEWIEHGIEKPVEGDSAVHPAVEAYVLEHELEDDEADYIRRGLVFTKLVHSEDVRDLIKAALEKYQLRKLRAAPVPAVGTRRKLADRDAEIAARRGKS